MPNTFGVYLESLETKNFGKKNQQRQHTSLDGLLVILVEQNRTDGQGNSNGGSYEILLFQHVHTT
ncbi:hypothetical protein I7I48_01532 [Histoplasma ohiense]|nr:hypothetical protein I7I48_01532 [Histoplasma ohiense (nom. inval.)]